ncbi:hypothetical protein CCR75_001820 [Bremia lactucae]|uniref:Uncharacterized protein n=1 Tax=Bremia lactucae TaxID=4779 RepID=A0A976IBI4_BRELC|nr:hypothetical protein CCR75_001820 [Bremia lactucae]
MPLESPQILHGRQLISDHKLVIANFALDQAPPLTVQAKAIKMVLARDCLIYDENIRSKFIKRSNMFAPHTPRHQTKNSGAAHQQLQMKLAAAEMTGDYAAPTLRRVSLTQKSPDSSQNRNNYGLKSNAYQSDDQANLRAKSNEVCHEIRHVCKQQANAFTDQKVSNIEQQSDSVKMLSTVRILTRKASSCITMLDGQGIPIFKSAFGKLFISLSSVNARLTM